MATRKRERLSLRTLAVASTAAYVVLALIVTVLLIRVSSLLREDTDNAIRDMRSLSLTNELESSLLMFHRVSNLYVLTEEPELEATRDDIAVRIGDLLQDARAYVGSSDEDELLSSFETELKGYFLERERAESSANTLEEIIRATRTKLGDSLELMAALRDMNESEVRQTYSRARQVDRLSNLTGAATGLLLLVGWLVFVVGVRQYVLKPILDLHEAIQRFRAGETHVRVEEDVAREPAELARAFNAMVEALVRQREDQMTSLAGVAHDLRNPLSALKMGIQVIERDEFDARKNRTLELMRRQINHLQRMVDDLLDATRIEAGKLEMQFEQMDLRAAVERSLQLYAPSSPDHEVVLDSPATTVTVEADPLRVEQVVGNLLSNAVKFSPPGSRIDVSVRETAGCGVVSVTDRGIGISPEDVENLFTPFRRNRPELAPGAGLGLSVVRRIVSAHGGTVEVDSELGRGSTFHVLLPRTSWRRASGEASEGGLGRAAAPRVAAD